MPTSPNPRSKTVSTNQVLGGVLGALGGIGFLYFSMHVCAAILRSDSIPLKAFGSFWSLVNLAGVFGYPITGFALGYNHMFTKRITRIDK